MDLSLLRLLGLAIGAILLFLLFRRLRDHSNQRIDIWGFAFFGAAFVIVSVFPNLINIPAEMLFVADIPGGRIMTLLVLATLLLVIISISNRGKIKTIRFQLNQYIQNDLAEKLYKSNPRCFSKSDILVIIPAWNEADNLKKLLPRFPKKIKNRTVKVLIVDDGSSDDTVAVCHKNKVTVVEHSFNRGGGAALRTGYAVAERFKVDTIVTMDADGQHNPKEIETLLEPIFSDEADFVIGSRIIGDHDRYSQVRIAGVHFFNFVINTLMGIRITDCASGFRAIRFSALGHVGLLQDQYHTTELIIDAAKKKLRFTERPIHIAARMYGESKKGKNLIYAFGFLKTVIQTWWR